MDEVSKEVSSIDFDDLPKQLDVDSNWRWGQVGSSVGGECVLRREGPRAYLGRPQPLLPPEMCIQKAPPISILYNEFSRRLDEAEHPAELAPADQPEEPAANSSWQVPIPVPVDMPRQASTSMSLQ